MNKKNSGFSLVELIVVIAIMAVLVGVLAPAYLKYVEKSRKSTDVDAISEIVEAAKSVAADTEYENITAANSTFVLTLSSGTATMTANSAAGNTNTNTNNTAKTDGNGSTLVQVWAEVANIKVSDNAYTYKCKSKDFKKSDNDNTFRGTILSDGTVTWTATSLTTSMMKYSSEFKDKFTQAAAGTSN